jgi:hypothetical protein
MQGRGGRRGGDGDEDWRQPTSEVSPPAARAPRWPQFLIKPKQEGPRFVYPGGPLGRKPSRAAKASSKKQQTTRKRQHKTKDWSASPAKQLKQARIDTFYASTKPPSNALQLDRFPPESSWSPIIAQKPLHSVSVLPRRRLPPLHVQPVPATARGAIASTSSPTPQAAAPPDWAFSVPNSRETAKRARLSYLPPLRTVAATGASSMPSDAGPQPLRTPFAGNCDTKRCVVGSASPSGINGGNDTGRSSRTPKEEERYQVWRRLCDAAGTNAPVPQQPKAVPQGTHAIAEIVRASTSRSDIMKTERLLVRVPPSRPSEPSYDQTAPPRPHSSPQATEKWGA